MRRALMLLLVAGALMAPATSAFAQRQEEETGLGIRLAEAPTASRDDPRARSAVVDHVDAGSSFSRRIQIRNGTNELLEPKAYVAAATIEGGVFAIGAQADKAEITRWARLEPTALRLPPGEVASATLHVDVPADAPDGEYYGAAVAEVRTDRGPEVEQASRVAIRIYLSVGDVPPSSDFEITELTASRLDDGEPVVTAEVRNIGGRALDMSGELELADGPAGLSAGPFPAELGRTLAIGDSQPVRVVLDEETPKGPWEATLTLRSGTTEHAVEGTITFPDIGERPEDVAFQTLEQNKGFPAVVAGALVALMLGGIAAMALRPRRLRRPGRKRHGGKRVDDAEGATTGS